MKNYEVLFEQCNGFRAGDIVAGNQLAPDEKGIKYLVDVGAIKETSKNAKTNSVSPGVSDQVEAAVAEYRKDLEAKTAEVTGLQTDIKVKDDEIADLTKKLKDAEKEIDKLRKSAVV